MKTLFLVIPFLIIFSSCSNPFESEISELDSLITLMDSGRSILSTINIEEMESRRENCKTQLDQLAFITDTLSKEDVFLIDSYSAYFKAYRKWSAKYPVFVEDIEVVPMQLKNLKQDLSKNLIEPELAGSYMMNERIAAKSLFETIVQMESGLKSINERYLESNQKILLLIQSHEFRKQSDLAN